MLLDNPLTYFVFGLLFAWVASYFYSIWHNRRKLTFVARWLEEALHILGSHTTSRWHGTDRLDILVGEGRGVIKEAAIVLGAQSRRLFSAMLSLVRGGRDSMSFLVQLSRNPQPLFHYEIFGLKEPLPQSVLLDSQAWEIEDYPRGAPYRVAFKTSEGRASAFRVIALLHDMKLDIRRVSVRPNVPQLFFVFNLPGLPQSDANELLRLIRNLVEEVVEPTNPSTSTPGGRGPKLTARERPQINRPRNRNQNNRLPHDLSRPGIDAGIGRNDSSKPNGHSPHN